MEEKARVFENDLFDHFDSFYCDIFSKVNHNLSSLSQLQSFLKNL
jgi:hypothetical protein